MRWLPSRLTACLGWFALCATLSGCPVIWYGYDGGIDGGVGGGGAGVGGGGGGGAGVGGGGAGVGGGTGNLAPRFDMVAATAFDEDTPTLVTVTGVTAGSAAEDFTQTVTLTAGTANSNLVVPSVGGAGSTRSVRLTPAPNANGQTDITLTADDGVGGTYAQTFHVTVNPVNDSPTVAQPADARANAPAVLMVHLTGIGPGGGPDEANQPLSILSVIADDPSLFTSVQTSMVNNGAADLSLTPHATNNGITVVTVVVSDGQAMNSTTTVKFHVMVNQTPPTLTALTGASGTVTACVALDVTVVDPLSLPVDVLLEVDQGQGFQPGTLQAGSSHALSSSPTGVQHMVVWRAPVDVIARLATNVQLRAFASRQGFHGAGSTLGPLTVDDTMSWLPHADFSGGAGTLQAKPLDLNGDGVLDVVTADSFGVGFSTIYGFADGGYGAPTEFATCTAFCGTPPSKPFTIDLGDLNHDGVLDAITVQENCGTIGVVLGDGDGGYGPFSTVMVGNNALFGTMADFNQDGNLDYAVVNFVSGDVSILLGNGNGTFQPQVRLPVGLNPNKIEQADFNLDGHIDLVTANALDNTLSLLLGDGMGGFTRSDWPAGDTPRNLTVADFNGDGLPDVATANPGANNDQYLVEVLLQTAPGTFAAPVPYMSQQHPRSAGNGDFNLDGRTDFVIGNVNSDSISVFINQGGGVFMPAINLPTGGGPHNVIPADQNKDGLPDFFTGDTGISAFSVLINTSPVCAP